MSLDRVRSWEYSPVLFVLRPVMYLCLSVMYLLYAYKKKKNSKVGGGVGAALQARFNEFIDFRPFNAI